MLHLNVRKICITVLCLVICCSFPLSTAAAEDASWQDRADNLWTQIKDKGSGFYESAKEKAPEVLEQAKDTAGKIADTVREQAPEVIDRAKEGVKDAQEAVSDWNASQQQQFWDRTEGLIYGEGSVATETDSDDTTANSTMPTKAANGDTAPTEATGNNSTVPQPTEHDIRNAPEISGFMGPVNENTIDYPKPQPLETGYYTINGVLCYFDAETNEMTTVTMTNPENETAEPASASQTTPVPAETPSPEVTVYDNYAVINGERYKKSLGVIIGGIVTIIASSIALALTIVAVRSRFKNSR